ncbi:rRNA pseudouridine synthase [Candidatus Woesearchaeota archaeon]|nr:rRNA pseudouridine synthase [Candidatus Woesearchaeota archaeon]
MQYRVQKIISMAGVCSRRHAEDLIKQGHVTVNGKVISLGMSADPAKDTICVDRRRIFLAPKKYYAFYKPRGYITALQPHEGKKPVSQLFPRNERLFPIGRLDFMTEGLLLLTNDGDFANKVMHPRYEVEKEYRATLGKPLGPEAQEQIKLGVSVEGSVVRAGLTSVDKTVVQIVLHEGRKHIVKKLFAVLGYNVKTLCRVRVGAVTIGTLRPSQYRALTKHEIASFGGQHARADR